MFDLTLYSDVIYFVIMAIVFILLLWWSARKIFSIGRDYHDRHTNEKEFREGPAIRTTIFLILLWTVYIIVGTAAWTLKGELTKTDTPENPAQIEAIEKILEHEAAPDEELIKKKDEMIEKRDIKPHQKKLSAFEKKMEEEAAKIRKRNGLEEPSKEE